jgi:hypothetical protein
LTSFVIHHSSFIIRHSSFVIRHSSFPQPSPASTMSTPGRPKALDHDKRKTVCSLVAAGVSLRQAAHFVGCDPRSIRREAARNGDFRDELAKSKAEALIHPLQTLHQAAQTNWRAALKLMELGPERAARAAPAVTKRDVNQYLAVLIEAIERVVKDAWQREHLFDVLSAAMPATIRRCWEGLGPRRNLKQLIARYANSANSEFHNRHWKRLELARELMPHLPKHLQDKLNMNRDLIEFPEPTVGESGDSARQKLLAAARRRASHAAGDDPPAEDFAPPDANNVRSAGRNPPENAPPTSSNQVSTNDLREPDEAKSPTERLPKKNSAVSEAKCKVRRNECQMPNPDANEPLTTNH